MIREANASSADKQVSLQRVLKKDLRRYAWAKHGGRLPDNEVGRACVQAMLSMGMGVKGYAPWLAPDEFERLQASAAADMPERNVGEYLGRLLKLSDADREQFKLWRIKPHDVPWSTVQKRRRQEATARAPIYKRKRQQRIAMARVADTREASALLAIGTSRTWQRVSDIVPTIRGSAAWRKDNGAPLEGASLRVRFNITLDALKARGLIESKIEQGRRGVNTRFVRAKTQITGNSELSPFTNNKKDEKKDGRCPFSLSPTSPAVDWLERGSRQEAAVDVDVSISRALHYLKTLRDSAHGPQSIH
jgi:hypothetical protein